MDEILNPIDGGQGTVVETPTETTSAMDADNPISDGQAGVVAPEAGVTPDVSSAPAGGTPQSREDNQAAKMARLRAERETRAAAMAEADKLIAGMGMIDPATGTAISSLGQLRDVTALINAQQREQALQEQARQTGAPVEMLRNMQQMQDGNQQLQAENQRLQAQLAALQSRANEDLFAKHLAAIQAAYPGVKAKHISELGEEFLQTMGAGRGLDPVVVYGAIAARDAANAKPVPPRIGSLAGAAKPVESEFLTEEEMLHLDYDRLLTDDAYYKKAMTTQRKKFGR